MEDNFGKINKNIISENQFMTIEFINKYKNDLNWKNLCKNIKIQHLINDHFVEIFSEYYDNTVTKVGDSARQASVSKEALTIVYNQAVEQRDKISGVSLDQEAADLVRFQQAYQASARIMSTANQLFDAILQIR